MLERANDVFVNTKNYIPLLVLVGVHLAANLGQKLRENALQKESTALENKLTIAKNRNRIAELQKGLQQKKNNVAAAKELFLEAQKTVHAQKQLVADLKKRKASKAEIKEAEAKLKLAENELDEAEKLYTQEKNSLEADELEIKNKEHQNELLMSQSGILNGILGTFYNIFGLVYALVPIYKLITGIFALTNKEKMKEYALTLRQQALEAKGLRKKVLSGAAKAAESVAANPF